MINIIEDKKSFIFTLEQKLSNEFNLNDLICEEASQDHGWERVRWKLLFPGGVSEVMDFYINEFADINLFAQDQEDKIRSKIAYYARLHIETLAELPNLFLVAARYISSPCNLFSSGKIIWRIADKIWWASGDRSIDFNFYSKRIILSKIYISVLKFASLDLSLKREESWIFLHHAIDSHIEFIGKIKSMPRTLRKKIPFIRLYIK